MCNIMARGHDEKTRSALDYFKVTHAWFGLYRLEMNSCYLYQRLTQKSGLLVTEENLYTVVCRSIQQNVVPELRSRCIKQAANEPSQAD
jgi:hypothetical protein